MTPFWLCISLAAGVVLPAQPTGPVAITNAIVQAGDNSPGKAAVLVYEKGKVKAVSAAAPAGVIAVDAKGLFITPGFVETRTQLGLFEVMAERSTVDSGNGGKLLTPDHRARDGFNPRSTHLAINRNGGVTTALLSPEGGILAGTGSFVTLADPPLLDEGEVAMFGSVTAAQRMGASVPRGMLWRTVRRLVDDARLYRANPRGFERGQMPVLSLSRVGIEATLPMLDGRLPYVVTVDRSSDIVAWLDYAAVLKKKGDTLRLVIASGAEAWLVADRLAAEKVPVIFTPSTQDPHSFDSIQARDDAATLLHQKGVPLIISSRTWANNVRRIRHEAGLAVAQGLPPEAALAAITSTPAAVFGLTDRGRLAPGQRADFVVWDGDPLDVTSRPVAVVVGGQAIPLQDRQRALGRKYLNR